MKLTSDTDCANFLDDMNDDESEMDELEEYLAKPIDACSVPMFWKSNCTRFPQLAAVAKQILSIPASSERNFSNAGFIMNEKRTNLSSITLDNLLFLHSNLE